MVLTSADALAGARVGGKVRALASLEAAGLPVPPWFVVLPESFWASIAGDERAPIAQRATAVSPSASVRAAVDAAFLALIAPAGRVAVRSSASDEDGAQHSFAGQLESVLHVTRERLPDAVAVVWRSGFSDRVFAYRQQQGLSALPPAPAVLVQRMVDARVAGVAFSADPVSGRRGIAMVSAVPGLGTGLVSGECEADTWRVDRNGRIVETRVAAKSRCHHGDPSSPGGVRTETVPEDQVNAPVLSDAEVRAVAELARKTAAHFGRPQDIEWAIEGSTLFLLQSRPITSLSMLPDPDAQLRIWDNSNIVESYSGVTTPLTFSFAAEIYEHVYRQFCRIMRVPDRAIAESDDAFRNMLGLVRGRLYYNLLNWYRVLALLPGFTVNRRYMEQMMGVRESLPDVLAGEIGRRTSRTKLADTAHLAWTAAGLASQHLTLDRRVRAFKARLDAALAPPDPPLPMRRLDELAAHYNDLRRQLLLAWDAPLVNDFFAMIFYGVLRTLVKKWCGDASGTLQNDLVGGQGGLVSAEPAVRLRRMARLASRDPALVALLGTAAAREAERRIAGDPELDAEYRAYLARFGERSVNELKLETETLLDDPLPLLRAIGTLARQIGAGEDASDGASSGDRLRAQARERVTAALKERPFRRVVFNWVLRHARARVADRENLRLERTRLFGRVRRIFLEIGNRLRAIDVLDDARDVFYLEVDEVLAFLDGRSTATGLRELVAVRRREFDEYRSSPPPDDRFETHGPVYVGHAFRRVTPLEAVEGDIRHGLGCCPGVVRGPVRVVTDPNLVDLDGRAVLVAEHTDPGWIMIFPSAMAVLVERGSLLSHAAIVARELGIPAVVSVPGVTRWLSDGDWVELDGSTGVVKRIPSPVTEPARAQ